MMLPIKIKYLKSILIVVMNIMKNYYHRYIIKCNKTKMLLIIITEPLLYNNKINVLNS